MRAGIIRLNYPYYYDSYNNLKHNIFNSLFYIENHMGRKLREISGSLVVTIPKQVCDLYAFKNSDKISFEPIGVGELRLRKVI